MDKYVAYWKRGWWAWLMILSLNVAAGLTALPLAAIFRGNESGYWTALVIAWVVVGAPFPGWVFERFAAGSTRIPTSQDPNVSSAA